jgi:hypothetical protein
MLKTNQDKDIELKIYSDDIKSNDFFTVTNNDGSKILVFLKPSEYKITLKEGRRIIHFANTYHEYAYYEQYED